jgi:hypothetical protein
MLKLQTATEFLYIIGMLFPKLLILFMYLKIFTGRKTQIITWIVIGVSVAHSVGNLIACFTICQPFEFKWNKTIDSHCADLMASYRYVSVPHIATDIMIFLLPWHTLNHLQMNKKRKLGIFFTFAVGSF